MKTKDKIIAFKKAGFNYNFVQDKIKETIAKSLAEGIPGKEFVILAPPVYIHYDKMKVVDAIYKLGIIKKSAFPKLKYADLHK